MELLVVVTIVAILAAVAMPNLQSAIMKARAAQAVGDLQVFRLATYEYLGDHHQWPEDVGVGVVPAGMAEYLPDGWSMTKERYALNYEGTDGGYATFVGIAVDVNDADFGGFVLDLLGPNAWTNGSNRFTWVFEWLD